MLALRARISAGFEAKMHGVDLNWMEHFSEFLREMLMNTGKTLFAQLMDFLPWTFPIRFTPTPTRARMGANRI